MSLSKGLQPPQLADLRRVEAERHDDHRRRDLEAGFAADELGVALHQRDVLDINYRR